MTPLSQPILAVVIPCSRVQYLRYSLDALAHQSCKDFKVYIGDDATPDDIESVCNEFKMNLDITYIRFDQNLGRTNLVQQWHRCIEMSSEPWIWLFSDDDTADPECVEANQELIYEL